MDRNQTYFLVASSVLPEVFSKVIEVKRILSADPRKPVNEAAREAELSRSAYYKYKDHVFPFYETSRGKVITLLFVVEDFSGILANIIHEIAACHANIVTINQNIPINGLADITISVETDGMTQSIQAMMDGISRQEGVRRQEILARE
jgi:chorismate mutase